MSLSGAYDSEVIRGGKISHRRRIASVALADLFVCVHSTPALKRTLEVLAREDIRWVILGKESNDARLGCELSWLCHGAGWEFSRLAFFESGRSDGGAGVLL